MLLSLAVFLFVMQVGEGWGLLRGDFHLLYGSRPGTAGGAIVGILVYALIHYWYHRARTPLEPAFALRRPSAAPQCRAHRCTRRLLGTSKNAFHGIFRDAKRKRGFRFAPFRKRLGA
jgi:hypothetical protein